MSHDRPTDWWQKWNNDDKLWGDERRTKQGCLLQEQKYHKTSCQSKTGIFGPICRGRKRGKNTFLPPAVAVVDLISLETEKAASPGPLKKQAALVANLTGTRDLDHLPPMRLIEREREKPLKESIIGSSAWLSSAASKLRQAKPALFGWIDCKQSGAHTSSRWCQWSFLLLVSPWGEAKSN